ncbi:Outer membrane protein beta-barrel domain-containing protein [Parelusimicrobium proximum]|uniref:outer membrane beta-barrel protein n=1 Tax=Parelusimicrobium proximum TaxID=3228953 RepID=UPI003D176F93
MKKILLCILICLSANVSVFSQEYKKGDILGEGSLILAYPLLGLWRGEFNMKDHTTGTTHDAKLGGFSMGLGMKGLYFLTDHLALGLNASNMFFPQKLASGFELDVRTNIFNAMVLSRYYFNPHSKAKYYVTLAMGIADTTTEVYMAKKEKFHELGFAGLLGLGFDYPIKNNYFCGLEISYHHNTFHDRKTSSEGHDIELYPRANFFAFSYHISKKF